MEQKSLAKWLKWVIAGMALCGLVGYAAIIPSWGADLVAAYPEFSGRYWPWLILLWATGVPCFVALGIGWGIASRVGRGQSFTAENARGLGWIARLAAGDSVAVFAGNVIFLLCDMSHPGVLLLSLLVSFAGVAVAVVAAALSNLTRRAAGLQEQSDLTI